MQFLQFTIAVLYVQFIFVASFPTLFLPKLPLNRVSSKAHPYDDAGSKCFCAGVAYRSKQIFSIVSISMLILFPSVTNGADVADEQFVKALSVILETKALIQPTIRFVTEQSYDKARSNIQFVLRQLQLQKNIDVLLRSSGDFVNDVDVLEAAGEAGSRLTNTAVQYDSTIYTCVFIPSVNGEISPSAMKYQKQAKDYYDQFNSDADILLKVAGEKQLTTAQSLAQSALKDLPSNILKNLAST